MKLDIESEDICINRVLERKTESVLVESDMIVPDIKPDILSCISTNGNVCVYKKEIIDGKVKVEGSIDTYIIYLSDTKEGEIRALNSKIDFLKNIEISNLGNEMNLNVEVKLKTIDCNVINGRKVNVKAYLEITIKTTTKENIQILKDVKNIGNVQKLNKNMTINSLIGRGETKAVAKDTIVIDNTENLIEILKSDLRIINKDFKISYNKILAKSEINTKIMYLTEEGKINTVEKNIPVMGFIDIENISEENFCDVKYSLKNILIKPNDTEEHSIYAEIEIEMECNVYENKCIDLVQDLYSPEKNIEFAQRKISAMSELSKSVNTNIITKRIDIAELVNGKVYDTLVSYNILNTKLENEKIIYEGNLNVNILYMNSETSRLDSKQEKIQFEYAIDAFGVTNIVNVETDITIKEDKFIVLSDGQIEAQITMQFDTKKHRNIEINLIDNIESVEYENDESCSIVIYFVKRGDTIWNIAKNFRTTVEEIATINNLEDPNKIYPGEQLLIPRYVEKKIG